MKELSGNEQQQVLMDMLTIEGKRLYLDKKAQSTSISSSRTSSVNYQRGAREQGFWLEVGGPSSSERVGSPFPENEE